MATDLTAPECPSSVRIQSNSSGLLMGSDRLLDDCGSCSSSLLSIVCATIRTSSFAVGRVCNSESEGSFGETSCCRRVPQLEQKTVATRMLAPQVGHLYIIGIDSKVAESVGDSGTSILIRDDGEPV